MRKHNFEHISHLTNEKINDKIKQLNTEKANGLITDREIQYSYLVFLQNLDLSKEDVFNVYTNTDFE